LVQQLTDVRSRSPTAFNCGANDKQRTTRGGIPRPLR